MSIMSFFDYHSTVNEHISVCTQSHQDGTPASGRLLAPTSSVSAEGPETTGQDRPDLHPQVQQQTWRGVQIHVRLKI